MKKTLNKLSNFFGTLFGLLIALLLLVIALLGMPYDIIKYFFSPYYKNTKARYRFYVTGNEWYSFYNVVNDTKIRADFYNDSKNGNVFFVRDGVLFIIGEVVKYDDESGLYVCEYDGDTDAERRIPLDTVKTEHLALANDFLSGDVCHDAMFWVQEDNIDCDDARMEMLISRGDVIIYSDNTALRQSFDDHFAKTKEEL